MSYEKYFDKFIENDNESVIQYIPNADAKRFLYENAPRLFCPDETIEETFAFRTFTMRKHIHKAEDGYMITEFLTRERLPWASENKTINAPLTHHLNEFRWLKCSDMFLDYVSYHIKGAGSKYQSGRAFAYHAPALRAIYDFCITTKNEDYLKENALHLEEYFKTWQALHGTGTGLYWSVDDREGTEYTISGTTSTLKALRGIRPLFNACMYADGVALSKIFALVGDEKKAELYGECAENIKALINERLWDGDFYKAVHPLSEEDLEGPITTADIPKGHDAREIMGYLPYAYSIPPKDRCAPLKYLKDESVFSAPMGFATADMSNPRFLYYTDRDCVWNGHVWPFATSYTVNAVIEALESYPDSDLSCSDLLGFIKKYAEMHYSYEDGRKINFIDEVMEHDRLSWFAREKGKRGYVIPGGQERGKDYNHSTFIDLVLRGLCGIGTEGDALTVKPRVKGLWKWFKIENLTVRKNTYTVYYDEDGTHFGKGVGVSLEKA